MMANHYGVFARLRKYHPLEIINAIAYIVRTGCQWTMLPKEFPNWKTVYHHFRSWSDRGWFKSLLTLLTQGRRCSVGQYPQAYECVLDSQSVRSARPESQKGVDGNKKIKGIKRHVAVDSNGYVLEVAVSAANVHDSKGAIPLIATVLSNNGDMGLIKADMGYLPLRNTMDHIDGVIIECVKSNFGTPDFIPIQGRWVVERTFSWMENYRRLTRNYERLPEVARHMFIAASVFFMLRYFA